jgi:ATP-binding cassette subfamily B protein
MSSSHQKAAIVRLFTYAKGYRFDIYLGTLYSLLNKLFDILPELLIGVAVDTVVNQKTSFLSRFGMPNPSTQIVFLGVITFAIWCLESLFQYLYSLKWRNLAQTLQHKLRLDAYQHIQGADMTYFENASSGNLVSILNDDINQLERFLNDGLNTIIQVFGSTVMIGLIFFIIAPKIALLAFLPVPLILFGAYYFQYLIGPRYAKVRAKAGELTARFSNNIQGIATIKSYTAEAHEIKSLENQSSDYQKANAHAIRISSAVTPVIRIAVLMGFLSALVYGGLQTIDGYLAVGAYSVLVFLTQRLLWPFTYLAEMTDQYYRAMASADRVLNLLAVPIHITSGQHLHEKEKLQGEIRFEDVSFSYIPTHTILPKLNLMIPAGSSVAFVGSTGSGKSTLVKLLMRFYDPQLGMIKIDGHSIKEFDLNNLRQHIGYVGQDVFLFEGTIAENIAYGTFTADQDHIERAAKLAEAHDFIMQLPDGYKTQIGERGQRLSGGQRQRLSIARAILKNPPILILDEATSAVDNETEAAIQRSINKIVKGRTTVIIAHRLSTVRHVDQIYVLEQGQIVQQGTHDQLAEISGIYADLWALQMGTNKAI